VEGFSESIQFELKEFNIKIKIIEPGIIKTDFYDRSKDVLRKDKLKDYDEILKTMIAYEDNNMKKGNFSDPKVVAETIYKAATDNTWKLRYFTGKYAGTILWLRRILPEKTFHKVLRYITLR
jgi:short-subunit dehydrogenase